MRLFNCLLAVLTAVLWVGCKTHDKPFYGLSDEQKAYFSFKPGSYWIMRDSVSGRIDSFVVTKEAMDVFYSNPSGHDIDIERKTISIDEYDLSTGLRNDSTAWQIEVFGYGSQSFERVKIKYGSFSTMFFYLKFDQSNVLVNSSFYNAVSINEEPNSARLFKVFLDRKNIILKVYYREVSGQFEVWELVRSHIIA